MIDIGRVVGEWVYHFQALIVGLLALTTIYFLRKQIKQVENSNKEAKVNSDKNETYVICF